MAVPSESPAARARAEAAAGLHPVLAAAAEHFAAALAGPDGAAARAYLDKRGVTPETARAFGLGYAADARGRLRTALTRFGFPALIEAGLLVAPDEGEPYDRFRGRLMFPIRDARGRVIAFGGRLLGPGEPKYLNSPDTPLFDKGRTLYNLDRAAPPARKSGRIVVAEGYMDAIALAQAGIDAVAPLGTALTEAQLLLLWRVAPEPLLCFDGDAAGQRAALRAALRALPGLEPGRSLRFATLPEGQDPDDVVRRGGAAAFEALLASAEPLIDRLWRAETEGADLKTPERRAAVRARLQEHARAITDASVRGLYAEELRARFDALFARAPRAAAGAPGQRPPGGASPALRARRGRDPADAMLAAVLVGLLERPGLADRHGEAVAHLACAEPRLSRLRAAVLDALMTAPDLDKDGLALTLAAEGLRPLADEIRASNRLRFSFTRPETEAGIADRDFGSVVGNLAARRRIEEELAEVTARFRDTLSDRDYGAQQRLIAERVRVDAALAEMAARLREADGAER